MPLGKLVLPPRLWRAWPLWALLAGVLFLSGCGKGATPGPATLPLHQVFEEIDHIHGLAVDPFEPELLWASSHNSLLQYTPAQGWQVVSGARFDLMGFTIHPREKGVLYSSGHPGIRDGKLYPDKNPLGFQMSRNGGQTWQSLGLVGEADFHVLALSPADPKLVYGYNILSQALLRSQDGGRTWKLLEGGSSLRFLGEGHGIAPHPQARETVMAATQRGLRISSDAGVSWSPLKGELAETPVSAVAYHPRDPQTLFAYAPLAQGLLRSDDGGQTWTALGFLAGGQNLVPYIAPHPQDPAQLHIGTTSADVLHSRDVGWGRSFEYLMKAGRTTSKR